MPDTTPRDHRRLNPFLRAALALSLAFIARKTYRFLRRQNTHGTVKPDVSQRQISRWEGEGGMVPEVHDLPSKTTH